MVIKTATKRNFEKKKKNSKDYLCINITKYSYTNDQCCVHIQSVPSMNTKRHATFRFCVW